MSAWLNLRASEPAIAGRVWPGQRRPSTPKCRLMLCRIDDVVISCRPHPGMCSTTNKEICLKATSWCWAHLGMCSTPNHHHQLNNLCHNVFPYCQEADEKQFYKMQKQHITLNLVFSSSVQFFEVTSPRKQPCFQMSVDLQHLSECLQSLWRQTPRSTAEMCPICTR